MREALAAVASLKITRLKESKPSGVRACCGWSSTQPRSKKGTQRSYLRQRLGGPERCCPTWPPR